MKEMEIIRGILSKEDADSVQAVAQIVSGLPRDFRLIFVGEAMAIAKMQGVGTQPPTPPRHAPAAVARAI